MYLLAVLVVQVGLFLPVLSNDHTVIRRTKEGRVRGYLTDRGVNVFRGIPFADPPERFAKPTEPSKRARRDILDCAKNKPMCYQGTCDDIEGCIDEMSEDCLYLNIFAPYWARRSFFGLGKAVMVFIHGGYFSSYTGAGAVFNGEELARQGDVIVVNINYRLGAFGFLYTGDGDDDVNGNLGYLDIVRALEWVRDNIQYFGGSPNRVTVFGESVGGQAILALLMSDKTQPLFERGILQSPPLGLQFKTKQRSEELSTAFLTRLGCGAGDVDCAKGKTADEMVAVMNPDLSNIMAVLQSGYFIESFGPWGPVVDGDVIPKGLLEAAADDLYGKQRLVMGTTTEELLPHVYNNLPTAVDITQLGGVLTLWRGAGQVQEIISNYVTDPIKPDLRRELGYIMTDFMFTCPTRQVARSLRDTNDIWMYVFDQIKPVYYTSSSDDPFCGNSVCHTAEVPFVFNSFSQTETPVSKEDELLAHKVVNYWSSFARYGNPNTVGGEQYWSQYQDTSKEVRLTGDGHSLVTDFRKTKCEMWDRLGYT